MIIASPWSRGGWVNSQVFDHTSSLQFLEDFLEKKTGKPIRETNISSWRRAVCGDLTSAFRPYNGEKINTPDFVEKAPFIESIHQAKFKKLPSAYKQLTKQEIDQINQNPYSSTLMATQEKGTRSSCALPYELYVDGALSQDKKSFEINFAAGNKQFGKKAAGSPFTVYAPGKYVQETMRVWSYATVAGDSITDKWLIENFENDLYHLCVYGPNGFFREFKGDGTDPLINVKCAYNKDKIALKFLNTSTTDKYTIEITDNAYSAAPKTNLLAAATGANAKETSVTIDTANSFGWYDFSVKLKGNNTFEKRYAGRIETGKASKSDPAMGYAAG